MRSLALSRNCRVPANPCGRFGDEVVVDHAGRAQLVEFGDVGRAEEGVEALTALRLPRFRYCPPPGKNPLSRSSG